MLKYDYFFNNARLIYREHYNTIINMLCDSMAVKRRKMKQYKVIKEFGCAQKGDVLQENKEGLFELSVECNCDDCYCSRNICISSDIADTLATAGYLEEAKEITTVSADSDKLQKVSDRIEELLVQYTADHDELREQYEEGEVPACVMTEADTVYFNMKKVLRHIQDLINE